MHKTLFTLFLIVTFLHTQIKCAGEAPGWHALPNTVPEWEYMTCHHFSIQHPPLNPLTEPSFALLRGLTAGTMQQTYAVLHALPVAMRVNKFLQVRKLKNNWVQNGNIHIREYFQLMLQHHNIKGGYDAAAWNALFVPPVQQPPMSARLLVLGAR